MSSRSLYKDLQNVVLEALIAEEAYELFDIRIYEHSRVIIIDTGIRSKAYMLRHSNAALTDRSAKFKTRKQAAQYFARLCLEMLERS